MLPNQKVRPFRPDADVLPLVRLLAEIEAVDRSGEALTEAELRVYLDVPQHDPETDRWVVEHPDGALLVAQAALSGYRRWPSSKPVAVSP